MGYSSSGKHEHIKSYDLVQLKKEILNKELFGFVQVDIETPGDLKEMFSEMCPIFKNAEIKIEDIGEYICKITIIKIIFHLIKKKNE